MRQALHKNSYYRLFLVGILNLAVDLGIFFLLHLCLVPVASAQIIGYVAGMLNSYVWNRNLTFVSMKKRSFGKLVRFISIHMITLMISIGLLHVVYYYFGISLFYSKLLATVCSVMVSYLGSSLWVFEDNEEPSSQEDHHFRSP